MEIGSLQAANSGRVIRFFCASAPLREILICTSILLASGSLRSALAEAPQAGPPIPEAAKVVGPDQCAKCHQAEVQQWMQTPHFATFEALHRNPRAKEIADKL